MMRASCFILLCVGLCLLMTGCVANMFPGGPTPTGILVSTVRSPAQNLTVATDASARGTKCGSSSASAVFGLFAFGDASVDAAMKRAGITKVHHVDHEVNLVLLGLFISSRTLVYGE
jgi:hypothetical protein